LALAVVGLGSSAFHATILKVAQAADELPMIYGSLIFFYCLVQRKREDKAHAQRWAVGLTIYSLLFTIGYAMLQTYFTLFIWSYAALATLLVLGITRVALSPDATPTHKRLAAGGALFFVGGVFLMWFPEHVFFTCDHPIQGLHLHAAWHLSAGLGTYLGILFLLYDRQHVLGRNPTLKFSRFLRIPYVSLTT
jgi:dihydroceramidase